MPLRVANNPTAETTALIALRQVIAPNTQLALSSLDGTGLTQIAVQSRHLLAQGSFPAVLLYAAPATYTPLSFHLMGGSAAELVIEYYDRWDEQPQTLDALWANLSLDLERMASNIENNPTIVVGELQSIVTITRLLFSPYDRTVDHTFPGIALLCRKLSLSVVLPQYLV